LRRHFLYKKENIFFNASCTYFCCQKEALLVPLPWGLGLKIVTGNWLTQLAIARGSIICCGSGNSGCSGDDGGSGDSGVFGPGSDPTK
jgi:hypothetical protein